LERRPHAHRLRVPALLYDPLVVLAFQQSLGGLAVVAARRRRVDQIDTFFARHG
jgi:hypothetical protein|tara:strand:- start:412 stop:573 length:162 start_codon:yes stop_codon:yes gene_type:complete